MTEIFNFIFMIFIIFNSLSFTSFEYLIHKNYECFDEDISLGHKRTITVSVYIKKYI